MRVDQATGKALYAAGGSIIGEVVGITAGEAGDEPILSVRPAGGADGDTLIPVRWSTTHDRDDGHLQLI